MQKQRTGQVLNVNLSTGGACVEPLDEGTVRKFLGGKGLGARLLYEELGGYRRPIDPLGELNVLVFAPGPLTGTWLPGSAKYAIVTKSPLTGTFLDTLAGGFFGPEIRLAGYDAVVVRGRAPRLSYLFVDDDRVELRDATGLRGAKCGEAEEAVKKEIGDPEVRVASIGPAGENLVRFACITNDLHRHAGRGGAGAVMGAKNLKAVAVRGTKGIHVHDPSAYKTAAADAYAAVRSSGGYEYMCTTGTLSGLEAYSLVGVFPTRNFRTGVFEGTPRITDAVFRSGYAVANKACYACNERCGQFCVVSEGKYAARGMGPEYESLALLGPNCGIDDPRVIIKANALTSELGMDSISTGAVVSFTMECLERGVITREDVGGMDLSFGNGDALLQLIDMIAYRRGLGDLLAEGARRASERLGRGSDRFAMQVKGLELPGYEPRSLWALALGYATSDRGGCHMRASTADSEIAGKWGDRLSKDTYAEGKGRVVKAIQDEMAWKNSACICKFPAQTPEHVVAALCALTGWDFTVQELEAAGERVYNLTRCFNAREGFRRIDDTLPPRCFEEPLPDGPPAGMKVDRGRFQRMLDDYYAARGWDSDGVPTRETIERLGLDGLVGTPGRW